MKTKTKLSIFFSFITATILLIFASTIFLSARQSRENEFYNSLTKEAITKANLFFNAKVDSEILQNIYRSNRKVLNEVEVAIYTTDFELLYHDAVDIDVVKETAEMIEHIYRNKEIQFYVDDWQVVGLTYNYDNNDYIVTAAAYDLYGYNKIQNLLFNICGGFVVSILIIFVAGRVFSKRAFRPIAIMNEKAKNITANNLDLRLNAGNNKDELSQLANTFNQMLDRLESSFDSQKEFVSNVSHELRTPLSAMIAELDLSANKEREIDEYKFAINNALNDARKLTKLTNNLLDFAKASYDPSEISFKRVRIDEVLLDARQQVVRANSNYTVDIQFEEDFFDDENEQKISIKGNEYLLEVAFANLFENGCKFSADNRSRLIIARIDNMISLEFSDNGVGIPKEDLDNIFIPFFRGKNNSRTDGNGIGLSLTKKIIELHNGVIEVVPAEKDITTFRVLLRHTV